MNHAIKAAISKFGSQQLLAERLGVRQCTISHYLNCRRIPRRSTANKLERLMDGQVLWHEFIANTYQATSGQGDLEISNDNKTGGSAL